MIAKKVEEYDNRSNDFRHGISLEGNSNKSK